MSFLKLHNYCHFLSNKIHKNNHFVDFLRRFFWCFTFHRVGYHSEKYQKYGPLYGRIRSNFPLWWKVFNSKYTVHRLPNLRTNSKIFFSLEQASRKIDSLYKKRFRTVPGSAVTPYHVISSTCTNRNLVKCFTLNYVMWSKTISMVHTLNLTQR